MTLIVPNPATKRVILPATVYRRGAQFARLTQYQPVQIIRGGAK